MERQKWENNTKIFKIKTFTTTYHMVTRNVYAKKLKHSSLWKNNLRMFEMQKEPQIDQNALYVIL